jgi:hypothetical protein
MRGEFENTWNDAFEGTSITPSEDVWHGIVSRMDSGNSKRNWVTILLIAATVTVAFAFPLTVGNSEYEFKPMQAEMAKAEKAAKGAENTDVNHAEQGRIARHKPIEPLKTSTSDHGLLAGSGAATSESNNPEIDAEEYYSEVNSQGVIDIQSLQEAPAMLLDKYYILPAYRSSEADFDKTLLAYGNINTGRQSAGSSFSNFNFLQASADFEQASGFGSRDFDNRYEDGGTTFYVGLGVEIPLTRRINLAAGIGYQNQRLNGSSNTIYEENGRQYPLGIYDPIRPGTIYLSQNYDYLSNNQFISIPVGAKYALIAKQVKFRIGLGVSPDFMLSHKVSSTAYGTSKTALSETAYNTIQFTGLLNMDVLIPLHKSYGLAIETGVRQGLMPYVEYGDQYTTSFNFGIILFYQLKK